MRGVSGIDGQLTWMLLLLSFCASLPLVQSSPNQEEVRQLERDMDEFDDSGTIYIPGQEDSSGFDLERLGKHLWTLWDPMCQWDVSNTLVHYQPWICSILASLAIGLSGVLPILIIPIEAGAALNHGAAAKTLRLLLSFAVGGLLGDVFLHLLPEAWHHMGSATEHSGHITVGLWVLAGVFVFIVVEMMFEKNFKSDSSIVEKSSMPISNGVNGIQSLSSAKNSSKSGKKQPGSYENGHTTKISPHVSNGFATQLTSVPQESQNGHAQSSHHVESRNVAGYLNLLANGIDNFTHGLAVAGSFLVSFKVGMLTTFAILIHEIPHEIGDFAILLKSGFNRCDAAKAQMATASVGLAGALAALSAESAQSIGNRTAWILPFTAGGFLNIALVNVLPDILQEKDPKESVKQLGCIMAGIGIMALVTLLFG